MKKIIFVLLSFTMVMVLVLANIQTSVQADSETNEWGTGKVVKIDLSATPAPGGQKLLSTGVTVSSIRTLCYPFPLGQFGWEGHIYQYSNGTWYRMTTTIKWAPDVEGKLLACAVAYHPYATYALFGKYVGLPETDD